MKEFTEKELMQQGDIINLNKFAFQLHYPIFQQIRFKLSRVYEIKNDMRRQIEKLGKLDSKNVRTLDASDEKMKTQLEKAAETAIKKVPENFTQLDIISFDKVEIGQKYRADTFVFEVEGIEHLREAKGNHRTQNEEKPTWYRLDCKIIAAIAVVKPVEETQDVEIKQNNPVA